MSDATQSCKTCKHSRWWLSASGKIKRGNAGHCVFDVKLPPLPYCISNVSMPKIAVWPDDGDKCECYEKNEGDPISEMANQ